MISILGGLREGCEGKRLPVWSFWYSSERDWRRWGGLGAVIARCVVGDSRHDSRLTNRGCWRLPAFTAASVVGTLTHGSFQLAERNQ